MNLIDAALSLGVPVFACDRRKRPCVATGFKAASVLPAEINRQFSQIGAALIGVPTGEASGWDALDVDPRHDGDAWELANRHRLPETRVHQTPSGGRHYIFLHAPGVRNSAGLIAPGIDVRGTGGYICAPPSPGYRIISDADPCHWPDWLLALVLKQPAPIRIQSGPAEPINSKRISALVDAVLGRVRNAAEGQKHFVLRNQALFLGGIQHLGGFSTDEAVRRLIDALPASARDIEGARKTARWGVENGAKNPIDLPDREQYKTNGYHHVIPPPVSEDDYGDTATVIDLAAARAAQEPPPPNEPPLTDGQEPPDKTPPIRVVAGLLDRTATAGEAALIAADETIYQRGPMLVRPVRSEVPASRGRTTTAAGLSQLGSAAMVDRLCRVARWEKYDGRTKEWRRIDPPAAVAATILSRYGEWTFNPIAGVITTPTLRPDGTLLTAPGYDPATRLYHVDDGMLDLTDHIPKNPTKADAQRALGELLELIKGFPTVNETDTAVALSALISPVVRGCCPVVPLHAIRASTAGTGKSFLVDVASAIATGRPCPVATVAKSEEETEKRLGGLLLAGFPVICLDNVNGELGGDLLNQAIERLIVQVRPLGTSDIIEIESRASIFATGNGLRLRGDMTRRGLVCNLDAGVERPELRNFEFDPVQYVMDDRAKYVGAVLTIVLAHAAAGFPGAEGVTPLASFQEWSKYVRGALLWLGCDDPCKSMEQAREDDPDLIDLVDLLTAWTEEFTAAVSPTVAEMIDMVGEKKYLDKNEAEDADNSQYHDEHAKFPPDPPVFKFPRMREILMRLSATRGSMDGRRLGSVLRQKEGRIIQGLRLERNGKGSGGVARWCVVPK